ncbi:hypothetical protein PG994_012615 [Apiospora phragmitis]|uniref:Uncharacterized protein n=1 Tax=Apiospora phragmitis TaxID=2905665 RepID=A0ABR1TBJ7_9PEZI
MSGTGNDDRPSAEEWSAPYCQYCGFDFEIDQSVRAGTLTPPRLTRITPRTDQMGRGVCAIQAPIDEPTPEPSVSVVGGRFAVVGGRKDQVVSRAIFRSWLGGKPHGCHAACYQFATLMVTERSFQSSRSYNERRYKWMRDKLASRIQELFSGLPAEVCYMISDYLIPAYAVPGLVSLFTIDAKEAALARPLFQNGPYRECTFVRRSLRLARIYRRADVWARHVHIDGVRYVASLSNKPPSTRHVHATTRVHTAGDVAAGMSLVDDPLGITDVQFFRENPAFGDSGDWSLQYVETQWRNLRVNDSDYILVFSDTVKVRDITCGPPAARRGLQT